MTKVSSLISTGRSSKRVFLFATAESQCKITLLSDQVLSRCASFSSFPIVPEIPLPISAARLANSDLLGFRSPFADPLAAAFCASDNNDCLWAPTLEDVWRRCAWTNTDRNSFVRSWIEVTAMMSNEKSSI
jgi:hypothetical protein